MGCVLNSGWSAELGWVGVKPSMGSTRYLDSYLGVHDIQRGVRCEGGDETWRRPSCEISAESRYKPHTPHGRSKTMTAKTETVKTGG